MNWPYRIVGLMLVLIVGVCAVCSSQARAAEKLLLVLPAASNPAPWHEELHLAFDDALSRELKISTRGDIRYNLDEALLTFSCERATPVCMRQVAGMFGVNYVFWTEINGTGPYDVNVQGVHSGRLDETYSLQHTFSSKTAALRAARPFIAALIAGIPYEGSNAPDIETLAKPQADDDLLSDDSIAGEQPDGQTARAKRKWPLRLAITSGVVGLVSLGVAGYYGVENKSHGDEMDALNAKLARQEISYAEYQQRFKPVKDKWGTTQIIANINYFGVAPIVTPWVMACMSISGGTNPQVSLTHDGIIFTSRF